jgi:hypothetical protein
VHTQYEQYTKHTLKILTHEEGHCWDNLCFLGRRDRRNSQFVNFMGAIKLLM